MGMIRAIFRTGYGGDGEVMTDAQEMTFSVAVLRSYYDLITKHCDRCCKTLALCNCHNIDFNVPILQKRILRQRVPRPHR